MRQEIFEQWLDRIYAAFGRAYPSDRVACAIFEQVEELPDEFMEWAAGVMKEREALPSNMGVYLARTLYPDWREKSGQPPAEAGLECPRCASGNPGAKLYWTADGEARICACDCCQDGERIRRLGHLSDWQLEAMGFKTKAPEIPANGGGKAAECVRRALAANWARRPSHMRSWDESWGYGA